MNNKLLLLALALILISCKEKFSIPYHNDCTVETIETLEKVVDFDANFSVLLPKTWKTNLYHDEEQSSIYSADTTKQLTESILLDITLIKQPIVFDDIFVLKQEQEQLQERLIKKESYTTTSEDKQIHHSVFKGKKDDFFYQKHIIHMKLNAKQFIIATIELYGNTSLQERSCKAINLLESIKFIS